MSTGKMALDTVCILKKFFNTQGYRIGIAKTESAADYKKQNQGGNHYANSSPGIIESKIAKIIQPFNFVRKRLRFNFIKLFLFRRDMRTCLIKNYGSNR